MALYYYVPSKPALLDGVVGLLLAEMEIPPPDPARWEASIRAMAQAYRRIAHVRPNLFPLVVTRPLNAPEVLRPLEATLAIFRAAGFDEVTTLGAFRAISSYVDGYALDEITGFSLTSPSDSPGGADGLEIARLDSREFPRLRELAPYFAAQDREAEFAFGLELIIAGLRARLDDHDRAVSEPGVSNRCPTSGRRHGHTS